MNWQEVCTDKHLRNLPYKIELNEWGKIVMSPATNKHGSLQMRIGIHLNQILRNGELVTECSITTSKGTKVADVAWMSDEFIEQFGDDGAYKEFPQAPEICVEIVSPSNTTAEMEEKKQLYFAQGAKEVWLCDHAGNMSFYTMNGKQKNSAIAPQFPKEVKVKFH